MGLEFATTWHDAGWLTSAVVIVVSMVWLFRATPSSPVRNAFLAVLLVLFLDLALYTAYWETGGVHYALFEFPDNVVSLVVFYFLVVWVASERGRTAPKWLPWFLTAVGVAVTVLWFLEPGWRREYDAGGTLLEHGGIFGIENALEIAVDVAATTLLMRAAIRRDAPLLALFAFGFAWAVVFGASDLDLWVTGERFEVVAGFEGGQHGLRLLSICATFGAAVYLVGAGVYFLARAEANKTRTLAASLLLGLAGASALLGLGFRLGGQEGWIVAISIIAGLLAAFLAVFGAMWFVAKANVGREAKVWTTIRRGSLPAMMVATFFVVSEIAQTFLSGSVGPIAGIIATAPLVLAISPIQRLGDRFGHAVVPAHAAGQAAASDLHPPSSPSDETYARQVKFAWADGRIGANERARLIDLRRSLGISADRAESIEASIVGDIKRPGSKRKD